MMPVALLCNAMRFDRLNVLLQGLKIGFFDRFLRQKVNKHNGLIWLKSIYCIKHGVYTKIQVPNTQIELCKKLFKKEKEIKILKINKIKNKKKKWKMKTNGEEEKMDRKKTHKKRKKQRLVCEVLCVHPYLSDWSMKCHVSCLSVWSMKCHVSMSLRVVYEVSCVHVSQTGLWSAMCPVSQIGPWSVVCPVFQTGLSIVTCPVSQTGLWSVLSPASDWSIKCHVCCLSDWSMKCHVSCLIDWSMKCHVSSLSDWSMKCHVSMSLRLVQLWRVICHVCQTGLWSVIVLSLRLVYVMPCVHVSRTGLWSAMCPCLPNWSRKCYVSMSHILVYEVLYI